MSGEYFSHFTQERSYSRSPIKLLSECEVELEFLAPKINDARLKLKKNKMKWLKKYHKLHDLIKADF